MEHAHALLGLTEYEARLYRALLEENPATAYRAGKASGVPLSRAYETAERLVQKGAAARLDGEPARYVPLPPGQLVASARARAAGALDALERDLAALNAGGEASAAVWVRGEADVLGRAAEMVRSARSVVVAAAPRALAALRPVLRRSRGVQLAAAPDTRDDLVFVMVADGRETLQGSLAEPAAALYTRDRTVAGILEAYARSRPAPARAEGRAGWLDWEVEKQRRLLASDDPGLPTQAH